MLPRNQMQMTSDPSQVQCRDGVVLMMRSSSGNPACVSPSTYWRLADRTWGNFDTELLAQNQNHMQGVMGAMINHPQMSQSMHDWMKDNPDHMQTMMDNWMPQMTQNNQWMKNMMGPMMNDPELSQQMMNHMINHPQMRQQWMQNQQFTDSLNDKVNNKKTETRVNSQTQVSIALGSVSPGCEKINECYLPYSVSIKENSSVTWTNDDIAVHTATSGITSEGPNGIFDSGLISPGTTFTNQFDEEETFDYYCIAHPWMTGNVVVLE